jgi:uncharacterized protein (DUF2461 family)
MSIQNTIDAFLRVRKQIKDQQTSLSLLKTEENELIKTLKSYLNETGESGIRIDSNTVITVSNHGKKINRNKRSYEQHVQALLYSRGISDDQFVKQLLDKTENVVQQQKLVLKKE